MSEITNPKKCHSKTCNALPTWVVYWPGQECRMCDPCTRRAQNIAAAMGFDLAVKHLGTTLELDAPELPADLKAALLASGMRETKCATCGTDVLTRSPEVGGKDYCPPHQPVSNLEGITAGDVVQIDPRFTFDGGGSAFGGALLIVEKLRGDAVQGYAPIPKTRGEYPARAYLRVPLERVRKIGRAEWVAVSGEPAIVSEGELVE